MKTLHGSFDPIPCHKCGKLTHISTRFGTPMPCANGCGTVHVAVAIVVVSGDDMPKPKEELTEADVAKMTPAQVLELLKAAT